MSTIPSLTMPHSVEFEEALLGVMLQDPAYSINEIQSLMDEHAFYVEKHKKIYRSIVAVFHESGGKVDILGLTERLKRLGDYEYIGGDKFIIDLYTLNPFQMPLNYIIKRVKELSSLRKVIHTSNDLIQRSYTVEENVDEFLAEAEKKFIEISAEQDNSGLVSIKDSLAPALEELLRLKDQGKAVTGVPSGIEEFDNLIGGFQKTDLIILAARPAMGKSAFALNIASHACLYSKCVVAIFSLEMAREQLIFRMLSSHAKVNSSAIRKGKIVEPEWIKITQSCEKLYNTDLFIDDNTEITVSEIRSKCRKLYTEKGKLDLVIIDYLQLIKGSSKKNDNREREIAEISRSLKGLAKELNCAVIALSQLNRSVEQRVDKRPKSSDLRESGSIEQDADLIFFIYREEVYQPSIEVEGLAEIIVGKNRHGGIDTVKALFFSDFTLFTDYSTEQKEILDHNLSKRREFNASHTGDY